MRVVRLDCFLDFLDFLGCLGCLGCLRGLRDPPDRFRFPVVSSGGGVDEDEEAAAAAAAAAVAGKAYCTGPPRFPAPAAEADAEADAEAAFTGPLRFAGAINPRRLKTDIAGSRRILELI